VVFVAFGAADVELAVAFEDPLIEVEDLAEPWRRVREFMVEDDPDDVLDAVVLLPTRGVPIPKIVDDPRVVVRVVEPLDSVERMREVKMGEEVSLVKVEDIVR